MQKADNPGRQLKSIGGTVMLRRIRSAIMLTMDGIMVTFISMIDIAQDRRKYFED